MKRRDITRLFSLTLTLAGWMSWNTLPIHSSGRAVCAATRASLTRRTEGSASAAVADGKIAFVSDRDGNAEIYTMNPDGSDLNRLTFDPRADSDPAWSPDGSRIVFVRLNGNLSGDHPSGEIYVMNADGSNQTRLTTSRNDNYPAWSPDRTKIAFSQDIFGQISYERGIYVMNADGSDQRLLGTSDPRGIIVNGYQPAWSPDGSKLAFTNGNLNIHSINADGSGARPLTERFPNALGLAYRAPSWSSDGAKIVFSLPIPARDDLFVMNSDGSGLTNITNTTDTNEWDPSWHPLSLTGCADSISPTSQSFEADGGTGSVEVTADSECNWSASSKASWISVTSGISSGDRSVAYSVAANTSTSSRTAALVVAGRIVAISQAGAPVRITGVSVAGKKLFVSGENFDPGAVIMRNGFEQKTKNDPQNPQTALIGKKAGKKIRPGDRLQVRNPNGSISEVFIFALSSQQ